MEDKEYLSWGEKHPLPYENSKLGKKRQIARMFDSIAHRYDLLNRLLSFGFDKHWRKKALKELEGENVGHLLDVATGTGDFALNAISLGLARRVTGLDISQKMLYLARRKANKPEFAGKVDFREGDAENLPFENNTFDVVTVAFGVRNFENPDRGLSELLRVLKPNGKLIILELSQPKGFPIKQFYNFYSKRVLPYVGRVISADQSAYDYLPKSVAAFPQGKAFINLLTQSGYKNIRWTNLSFGTCSLYTGIK